VRSPPLNLRHMDRFIPPPNLNTIDLDNSKGKRKHSQKASILSLALEQMRLNSKHVVYKKHERCNRCFSPSGTIIIIPHHCCLPPAALAGLSVQELAIHLSPVPHPLAGLLHRGARLRAARIQDQGGEPAPQRQRRDCRQLLVHHPIRRERAHGPHVQRQAQHQLHGAQRQGRAARCFRDSLPQKRREEPRTASQCQYAATTRHSLGELPHVQGREEPRRAVRHGKGVQQLHQRPKAHTVPQLGL
jgi:hypothetical protein